MLCIQVIFDEAHNVESSCEDASSFELTSIDIASFMSEIDQVEWLLHALLGA